MAFVIKSVKTIRNNWKKTIFFTGVAAYGVKYANDIYEDSLLRKAYCLEAKKYGDVPVRIGERMRKVTVFLNPAARNGRARKLFEKNVAPILHLAGLEVTVVKTEYEGQAKKYMEVLEDTDGIIVAGGDGTLLEVVTGILRRPDADEFASKTPIGFMPVGSKNRLAEVLTHRGRSEAMWQVEAAMSVIKGVTRKVDVMHIKAEEDKHVYAVNGLEWGLLTDCDHRQTKNWYMPGPLKKRWCYFRETIRREWPPNIRGVLTYTSHCDGCSKCWSPPPQPEWRWWHFLLPRRAETPAVDYSNVENEDCGVVHVENVSTMQLDIATPNDTQLYAKEGSGLKLRIAQDEISRFMFIREGKTLRSGGFSHVFDHNLLRAGSLTFTPDVPKGKEDKMNYIIHNENFEMMPIEVKYLKDKLSMFCSYGDQPYVTLPDKS